MLNQDPHPSDEDLLLAADGELDARRQTEIERHLQACWACRSRMAGVERTIADFVDCYHSVLDSQLPAGTDDSGLLRTRLAREATVPKAGRFLHNRWFLFAACAAMIFLATGRRASFETEIVPNSRLTPGDTVPISKSDVCQGQPRGENQQVPEAIREAVFSEYGMKNAPRSEFEVDFLITPDLGGSTSIRNLWPEPYHSRAWNAYTKDRLEQRLHTLVCSGQLDLPTAQREIATNWVDAYNRYVGARTPVWR